MGAREQNSYSDSELSKNSSQVIVSPWTKTCKGTWLL